MARRDWVRRFGITRVSLVALLTVGAVHGAALATTPEPVASAIPMPEIPPFAVPAALIPTDAKPEIPEVAAEKAPAAIPMPEIPPFAVPPAWLAEAGAAATDEAARPRDDLLIIRGIEIPGFAMPSGLVLAPRAEEPPPAPQSRIEIETPPVPALNLALLQTKPPAEPPPRAVIFGLDLDEARARAMLEPLRTRLRLRPGVIEQLVGFYAARAWLPLWLDEEGRLLPKAQGVREAVARAAEDGLDPARLQAILPASLAATSDGSIVPAAQRAEADLALSLAAFTYAQDARGGRLEPKSLSGLLTPALRLPEPAELLEQLHAGENPEKTRDTLMAFNPPHAGYRALRDQLARLRAEAEHTAAVPVASKPVRLDLPPNFLAGAGLNPGQDDARVPHLRLRLGLPAAESNRYDAALVEAVREFQRANGLKPDGRLTSRTRSLLEDRDAPIERSARNPRPPDDATAVLIANMERWRWLPPELGRTHILVNIPDFRLQMMDDGAAVFETRVIVGKPERPTPVFSDEMEFLVVNPSWSIPPTILRKDVLPKLAADPGYAARMGYQVIRRGNSISVRQPPGERNALGLVKFMFPNEHAVYLHDTPGRHLFNADRRAFSSGCVRVEGPFQLAEHLLLKRQGVNERQLRAMVGGGERTIRLNEKVPVHLAYFTLSVDPNGVLVRRPDLYGHDARIARALAL